MKTYDNSNQGAAVQQCVLPRHANYVEETQTKLGYMDEIEWGWLAHERREKLATFYKRWDAAMAALVVLQVTLVSFSLTFNPGNLALLGVGYFLDICHVVDVCAKNAKNYAIDMRNLELRPSRSQLNKYFRCWFIMDIIALIPFESLLWMQSKKALRMPMLGKLRANRLLCGYKVFRYFNFLESHIGANILLLRGCFYAVLTWFLLQFTACIWYLIPCSYWSDVRDGINYCSAPSWIFSGSNTMGTIHPEYDAVAWANKNLYEGFFDTGCANGTDYVRVNASVIQSYIYSLYWTITTASTVGFGEVHGITKSEQVFAAFCQLEGAIILFGYIQGGLTSMLTNFDVSQFRYKMRVNAITYYLRDQNQPSELVREVILYYRYLWESSRGMMSSGLFDRLPFALRSEISMELNGRIFDKSPLFQNINASFLRMLSLKLHPMLALPDQVVMQRGELSNMMVYIQKGQLEVLSDDEMETPILLLKPGKMFGEINLITRMPRKYSVRAIAHCDLVVLETEDLMDCLQAYPDVADDLRSRAEERAGISHAETQEGILANPDTHESFRRKKENQALSAKLEKLGGQMGKNMRPLMGALKIHRPQETLQVSESMELFRIRDPMADLVEYFTSDFKGRIKCRYKRFRTRFNEFSLDPDGLFLYFWTRLVALVITATFFLNTYVAFFACYSNLMADSTGEIVLFFSYFMDLFLIADFAINFFTQISTANGKISDHHSMVMNYLKSPRFIVDLIAIFPMEIGTVMLVQGTHENSADFTVRKYQYLGWLKVNRCLKLLSLPRFFDHLSDELITSTALIRMIKFVIYICVSAQAGAVVLISTTCNPDECQYDPTVDPDYAMHWWTADNPPNITGDSTPKYRYTSALYYAVSILTTTGYGDIYPHNSTEQLAANFVMFMGILVYGYCIAILTATLANLDGPRVEFQSRLQALKNFMEFNKMAESVKNRAVDSVALLWTMSKGEDVPGEKSMTADLPIHLAEAIQVEDLLHLVASVPLFKNLEGHILKSFAPAVRRYLFPPAEYIIQHGDLIDELFIIRRGVCQIFHTEHTSMVIGELLPGMYFGEIGFLFNHNEIVSVKTVTHCEVLTIPRSAFDKVIARVPWFSHQMKVIRENNKYYQDMCNAANNSRGITKKRREESPPRTTKAQKRKLTFNDDFTSLNVGPWITYCYKCLMSRTFQIDGNFLFYWEQSRLAASIVIFIMTLLQVTYAIMNAGYTAIMVLLDLYAFVDLYLKFHVQYYNEINVLVVHPYMTARRYLNSNFWIDMIAVFPYELFLVFTNGGTWSRPDLLYWGLYLRLNRVLQIYRLPLAFSFYVRALRVYNGTTDQDDILQESDIKKNTSRLMLLKFGLYFLLLIMLVTCMPFIVECPPQPCGADVSTCGYETPEISMTLIQWNQAYESMRKCTDNIYLSYASPSINNNNPISSNSSVNLQFIYGFYFAMTTFLDVGYGDIHATSGNQSEQVLFSFFMVAGYIFFGYVLASIAAAQANSDARRSRFFDRLTAIKEYMHHERLLKPLRIRVIQYYGYLWLRTQGVDPNTLIVGLPPSLTAELALQLYRKVIEQVPLFKSTPTGFKKMLAAIVKPLYVRESEYVVKVNDTGSDLYFVFRGTIEIHYCNGVKSPKLVRAGSMLGEVAFFTNETSKISCKAMENSDLYYVTKVDFEEILLHFPDIRDTLLKDVRCALEKDDEYRLNTKNVILQSEQRKQKGRFRDSLEAIRKKKISYRERMHIVFKATFRSDDQFIRNFSKFFVSGARVISIMLTLYQAAFKDYRVAFYAIHYILEIICLVNISLQLRTGFLDEFGNEVTSRSKIWQRYFRSTDLFLTDLAASFPYEVIAFTAPSQQAASWWAYLRCIRLFPRLFQVMRFFSKWLAELDINVLLVRMIFSFTQLFLWIHFFTCVIFFIADQEEAQSIDSWLKHSDYIHPAKRSPKNNYIVSLYFIVTTATTTGYGDLYPETNLEIFFICIVQVTGKLLFGIIVGDIASTLANLEISRQNFESKFQAIKTYLIDRQANDNIIDRVRKYFDYLWTVDRGVDDINTVLMDAPFCLRMEITYAVHHKDMRELPLFRDASDAFVRMLSSMLHQVQFVPGDYIIQQGDLVEEMYFLHRGEAVEVENGVEISVLRKGSNVNWQALLIDWPASRTVRATDNCEVYVLTRKDLNEVVDKYKDEMGHVCTTNRIRLRDLLEEERIDFD